MAGPDLAVPHSSRSLRSDAPRSALPEERGEHVRGVVPRHARRAWDARRRRDLCPAGAVLQKRSPVPTLARGRRRRGSARRLRRRDRLEDRLPDARLPPSDPRVGRLCRARHRLLDRQDHRQHHGQPGQRPAPLCLHLGVDVRAAVLRRPDRRKDLAARPAGPLGPPRGPRVDAPGQCRGGDHVHRGRDGLRHRQDLPLADDAGGRERAVPQGGRDHDRRHRRRRHALGRTAGRPGDRILPGSERLAEPQAGRSGGVRAIQVGQGGGVPLAEVGRARRQEGRCPRGRRQGGPAGSRSDAFRQEHQSEGAHRAGEPREVVGHLRRGDGCQRQDARRGSRVVRRTPGPQAHGAGAGDDAPLLPRTPGLV